MRGIRATVRTVRRRYGTALETVRRACAGPGRERDLAVQAVKAALAAWLVWAVVGWWLKAPMAFVAPWVAVVLVESTVYRSVAHGLQQLAAIAFGTVAATAGVLALGNAMAAMALVLPVAVLLGNWRQLGSQGIYAATGALFVLTGPNVSVIGAGARIAEAVFGALVGIAVNALIRPPVYLRNTRAALQDAAGEAHDILASVAEGIRSDDWDSQRAEALHERALRLSRLVEQALSSLGWSRESLRVNPLHRRSRPLPGQAYDDAVAVLDYVAVHTAGVTRTVMEAAEEHRGAARPHPRIAGPYADFLDRAAEAIHLYARNRFGEGSDGELREAVGKLDRALNALREQLPGSVPYDAEALAVHGALLAQATRLAEQLPRNARPDE
ncbi:aromatic acid exporter family protein [Streptomyces gossypiisoli]|uniref:aromatic acid exporter family protein n=1 Tax=Streptomyces gossypiisoli TaxID=2748864 RepID=UPI0015DB3C81|nr:aromatic acid exporter family protein [Streptomyces gossypiisoli]